MIYVYLMARKRTSKYVILNRDRGNHLVVSTETHDAVKFYAAKHKLTLTEATQRLLTIAIDKVERELKN